MIVKDFEAAVKHFHSGLAGREYNRYGHMECATGLANMDNMLRKRTKEYSEALLANKLHADNCEYCKGEQTVLPFNSKDIPYQTANGLHTIAHLDGVMCHLCERNTFDEDSQEIFDNTIRKIKFGLPPAVEENISSDVPQVNDRSAAYASIIEHQLKLLNADNMKIVWELNAIYGDDLRVSDLGHVVISLMRPHTIGYPTDKVILSKGTGQVYYELDKSIFHFQLRDFKAGKRFEKVETLTDLYNVLKKLLPHSLMSAHYE